MRSPASRKVSAPADPEIGRPRLRVEDDRLLTGRGSFVDDHAPPGCLHLVFFRSPRGRARIVSLGVETARRAPGVAGVITAADIGEMPAVPVNLGILQVSVPQRPWLARDDVRYAGEPIAAVVAHSLAAARDAAELIEVDLADAPATGDAAAFQQQWRAGDPARAFAAADEIVRLRIEQPRVAASPLEGRAALAEWQAAGGQLTFWTSSQSPHRARADIAQLLGIEPSRVRAIAPDVGGAFGSKASIYPEEVVVAWAARALARPVKWAATRGEDLLSATHGRGGILEGELALKRDGTLLGLRAAVHFPLGAWLPYSAVVPAWNAARILPGPYRIENVELSARGTPTDTAPMGIYRGAGRPEAAMLLERLIDEGARALGMDAADLRRRNLLPAEALPRATAIGETLDSGDYPRLLSLALRAADYPRLCAERERRRARGEIYGIGIGFYLEPCGRGAESATVRMERDGRVLVASGTSPQGQGHATAFAQIAADALGVPFEAVAVVQGDTQSSPPGVGALASRSTAIGGSAVLQAATQVRERWHRGEPLPLEAAVSCTASGEAWSSGCCVTAVAIDRDTGELAVERFAWADDAGVLVNPLLVEGQLCGGYAQGLGQALLERLVYDEQGQLLTGSLMDYALPRAGDMPPLELAKIETPSTANPLGAKGVGESGTIGVPAALLNAAVDALAPEGVQHLDLPLTSEKLWRALHMENDR